MLSTFLLSDCTDVFYFQIEFVVLDFHCAAYIFRIFIILFEKVTLWLSNDYQWHVILCSDFLSIWTAIIKFGVQSLFLFFSPLKFWHELFYFYLDRSNRFINLCLVIFVYPRSRKYGNPNQNKNGQSVNHSADVCQQIHCWKMKCENFGYYSNYFNLELYSIVITSYHLWFLNLPTANFRDSTKSSTRKTPLSFLSRVFTLVASRSVSSNTLSEEIVVSVSKYF